jgi:hypothetical protein
MSFYLYRILFNKIDYVTLNDSGANLQLDGDGADVLPLALYPPITLKTEKIYDN